MEDETWTKYKVVKEAFKHNGVINVTPEDAQSIIEAFEVGNVTISWEERALYIRDFDIIVAFGGGTVPPGVQHRVRRDSR